jgi:hypothetical protein
MFAEASESSGVLCSLFVLAMLFWGAWRAYIYFWRPDIWEADKRVQFEQLQLKLEHERQKQEQRSRSRNQLATGILGAIMKGFFGHRN